MKLILIEDPTDSTFNLLDELLIAVQDSEASDDISSQLSQYLSTAEQEKENITKEFGWRQKYFKEYIQVRADEILATLADQTEFYAIGLVDSFILVSENLDDAVEYHLDSCKDLCEHLKSMNFSLTEKFLQVFDEKLINESTSETDLEKAEQLISRITSSKYDVLKEAIEEVDLMLRPEEGKKTIEDYAISCQSTNQAYQHTQKYVRELQQELQIEFEDKGLKSQVNSMNKVLTKLNECIDLHDQIYKFYHEFATYAKEKSDQMNEMLPPEETIIA